jgi:hypothetical protein
LTQSTAATSVAALRTSTRVSSIPCTPPADNACVVREELFGGWGWGTTTCADIGA